MSSGAGGAATRNVDPKTFQLHWDRAVATHGDKVFLLFEELTGQTVQWSYSEFGQVVDSVAATLDGLGVRAGDAIHVVLHNCPAFVALWLAAARLRAWIVPVDPASTSRDIARQIERVSPAVGVCAAASSQIYRAALAGATHPILELTETAADVVAGSALRSSVTPPPVRYADGGDRLAVMFTSGTTSEPKGVVLTQRNYAEVADVMSRVIGLEPGDRWLVTLPLFHANAQYYCFAPAIAAGASVALTATFSASRWLDQAHRLRASHASLFAAPIRMILAKRPDTPPPVALRHLWYAQSIGAEHHREFAALIGCVPRQLYGMTETVAIVTADVQQPYTNDVIGHPIPGRTVRIVDPETGETVRAGEPGMLLVHGVPGRDLFEAYLDDPATTSRSYQSENGHLWFRTGDIVVANGPGGALRFVGRADDVIKVAGENVSLSEVEAVVAQAPGVLEVAVVAKADPIRDQVPVAFVVARDPAQPPNLSELAEWAAHNLPPQARPREWQLIGELPRTSVGKVRRFQIGAELDPNKPQ